MKQLRSSAFPVLLFVAAGLQSFAAPEVQTKRSSANTAIREEFRYQPARRETEETAPFSPLNVGTSEEEIIRLPNYVVRETPDSTMRDLELALAQRKKLSSGAVVGKDLGKHTRFEALLPVWLDMNVKGDAVFRLDVLRLSW
jgi:hypothetical protein